MFHSLRIFDLRNTLLELISDTELKNIPFVPLPIALGFDQFNDSLLLQFNSGLLFSKPIQLGLLLGYLLALFVNVVDPRIGIFVPHVQDRPANVAAQVVECVLSKERNLTPVVFRVNIIKLVWSMLEVCVLEAFNPIFSLSLLIKSMHIFLEKGLILFHNFLLEVIEDLLVFLIDLVPHHEGLCCVGLQFQWVIVGVAMVAAL